MGHHMITRSKKNTSDSYPNSEPIPSTTTTPRKGRKKQKIATRNQFLPIEIVSEILSWLPVKYLIICKSVSKQWYELIQDRNFVVKNMERNSEYNIHYLGPYDENGEIFKWIYNFDGLVLESTVDYSKFRIKNVALRRVMDLPAPPHQSEALIPSLVHHGYCKLVSAYGCKMKSNQCGGFEILTLGRDSKLSWRALDTNLFWDFNRKKQRLWALGIKEIAYFVRISKVGSENYEVVSCELENESSRSCGLSRSCFPDSKKVFVLRWEDDLALAEIANKELHVLVLEDYKRGKWAEKKTIIPLKFLNKEPYMDVNNLEPLSVVDGFVWFRGSNYLAYSIAEEEIVSNIPNGITFRFRQSLVTLKGMRPDERYRHK